MIRAAVFDFDGVVLESVDIKTIAFRRLFADHPEGERIVPYHLANGGVSRFEKFRWFYEEVRGEAITEAESLRWAIASRSSCSMRCPLRLRTGAKELLERLAPELPLFVASATPEDELREIVASRDLAALFVGVHGSPPARSRAESPPAHRHGWTHLAWRQTELSCQAMRCPGPEWRGRGGRGAIVGRVAAPVERGPVPGRHAHRTATSLSSTRRWGELDATPPPLPAAQ